MSAAAVVPAFATGVPPALTAYLRDACRLPLDAFTPLDGPRLPQPDRSLLDHNRDMTSTLADFHASPLRVEVLQSHRPPATDLYLREVFLRTAATGKLVEYGVLAVSLPAFTPAQREAIESGRAPLGALLHEFRLPFLSSPLGFFAASPADLAATPLAAALAPACPCHGRLNRLYLPSGATLAWILEILPPAPSGS